MFRGLRGLLVAAAAGAVFAVPTAAFAGNGNGNGPKCTASACKVYIEQGASNGTGQQPPTTGSGKSQVKPVKVPKKTSRAIAHAGKDKKALTNLVKNPGFSVPRGIEVSKGYGKVSAPSALGAAFDVGSGPTALFGVLAGVAVLLLGTTGLGAWRRRRP
jgi:hypothetical protein